MSSDPRVEAWVRLHTPRRVYPTAEHGEVLTKRAEATLRVLDATDREQGIHRIKVDDKTVEKVARALWDHAMVEESAEWREMAWNDMSEGEDWERGEYDLRARAVIAALAGAGS